MANLFMSFRSAGNPDGPVANRARRRLGDHSGSLAKAPRELADADLVSHLARDVCRSAVAELYRRYGRVGYSLARRLCGDDKQAEEVVLDVFVTLLHTPEDFGARHGSVATRLLSLTHHKAVAAARGETRPRRHTSTAGNAAETNQSPSVDHVVPGQHAAKQVHAALQRLPLDQRQPLALAYYEGHTQAEVAATVGAPLGIVRSRMFAGVQRLRVLLETDTTATGSRRTAMS